MSVSARLFVKSVEFSHRDGGDPKQNEAPMVFHTVKLTPVTRSTNPEIEEDSIFGRYTPKGECTLTMERGAASQFVVGETVPTVFDTSPRSE